jgi:hypothetical protein
VQIAVPGILYEEIHRRLVGSIRSSLNWRGKCV